MFILNPGKVQYCRLSYQSQPLNGLNYLGHLFVQVRSYSEDHLEDALRKCRELLEVKASVLSIITKEPNGFTLWSEEKSVQLLKEQNSPPVTQQPTPTNNPKAKIKYRGVEISPQSQNVPTSPKATIKYRGVEISTQTQNLPTSPKAAKSELKYRGRSCL